MASDAAFDRRNAGVFGTAGILVTILARDFVESGMDPMAEWDGLYDIHPGQPRALRKRNNCRSDDQPDQRERKEYPVHRCIKQFGLQPTRAIAGDERSAVTTPQHLGDHP